MRGDSGSVVVSLEVLLAAPLVLPLAPLVLPLAPLVSPLAPLVSPLVPLAHGAMGPAERRWGAGAGGAAKQSSASPAMSGASWV